MNINWKDFGLMYVIAFVLYLLHTVIIDLYVPLFSDALLFTAVVQLINLLFVCGIPLMFYFWRNKSDLKETGAISFIFAFTISYVLLIYIILRAWIIQNEMTIAYYAEMNLLESLGWQIFKAIITTIYGLIIWFVIKQIKKK